MENTPHISELPNGAPPEAAGSSNPATAQPAADPNAPNPLSKNQQKKLKRQQAWEARRDARRAGRKDKRLEQRARKREAHAAAVAEAKAAGLDPKTSLAKPVKAPSVQVPVSIILDCSFDQCMTDKEIKSLASQVMRSYSENRSAQYKTHLVIGPWGGKLKKRFDVDMNGTHQFWKGVHFTEGDLGDAANKARELMHGSTRGDEIDVLKPRDQPAIHYEEENGLPTPHQEEIKHNDVVYLSSDSPYVLDRLEPNTSYVVGGLVDRNREKGLCYRLARERGVRTAKLPIGEYLVMASRRVLATNHVVEIMLRWLECGDWGEAFLKVIPSRKGGRLRKNESTDVDGAEEEEGGDEGEEKDEAHDDDAAGDGDVDKGPKNAECV